MKVVPRPEEVKVNLETRTLDRARARQQFNPPDLNALEWALTLRDRVGGQVSVLSMGPPFFVEYLRVALAVGADAAYLLSDRAFGGADTLATSLTLACGIRKIGDYDLVLCGEESSDGATAQVPPGIAEWLGVNQITYVSELEVLPDQARVRARRELARGYEVLAVPLPAVVSVRISSNEPRFIDFVRLRRSEAEVVVWGIADLDVDPGTVGLAGSATTVAGLDRSPGVDRKRVTLTGSRQEQVRALVASIAEYLERPVSLSIR